MAVNRFVKGPCASFCVTVFLELCVCLCVWPQELYVGLWDWSLGSSSWQGVCHFICSCVLALPCVCTASWSLCPAGYLCVWLSPPSSCWTRNSNMNYWLIIRLPILFAIGVSGGVSGGGGVLTGLGWCWEED